MSTTRVLIRQGDVTYRFMLFEARGDGSLLAFLDRDPRSRRGSYTNDEKGQVVPERITDDKALPSAKFSIHTTGVVHRYAGGERKGTIHIEPLHQLTQLIFVAFVSIPCVSRLDLFDEKKHQQTTFATLEVDEGVTERITFSLEIGPAPQTPKTFGVSLDYELYSLVVRVEQALTYPPEITNHFIHGMYSKGMFETRQADPGSAELNFHQQIHGRSPIIFRERSGAYVALGAVPMARPPQLILKFNRDDLYIAQVPFDGTHQPTHKVRFWICDKGGKNRVDDLRMHITSMTLES
jgi:hypothetical protein